MRRAIPSTEPVGVRHLDDIQEEDPRARPSRLSAMVMASFGGACIVFAALVLMRNPQADTPKPTDPLGELVQRSRVPEQTPRGRALDPEDVTFPSVLSDQDDPTTAMAAVRGRGARSGQRPAVAVQPPPIYSGPPPAMDRLPVVPLPAHDVLHRSKAEVASSDTLRKIAREVSREQEGETSPAGQPGGYQLQVSSFRAKEDADSFAAALRRRGHRAHVEQAHVKGRGVWHRVRIGPFRYRRSADIYRQDFEAKERMATFVVNPPKAKIRIGLADNSE